MHDRTVGICVASPHSEWACAVSGLARLNEPPHCAHLCNFSPGWVTMCFLNTPASPTDFLHFEQVWVFTLHSTVDEQMPFKISSLTKWPIALDTGKILFSDVGRHVTSQISSLIKWLLAFWGKMHLFPILCKQMPRHFTLGLGWIGNNQNHGVCSTEWSETLPWPGVSIISKNGVFFIKAHIWVLSFY